jgi:hypothetical protein
MIVHHADRLHVRINGRPNEAEPPVFEIITKRARFLRGRRNLPHCSGVGDHRTVHRRQISVDTAVPEIVRFGCAKNRRL